MIKRAWYYVTRKWMRSMILILVIGIMGTSIISALSIQKAAEVSKTKTFEKIGSGFTISNNVVNNLGTSRGEGNVPADAIDKLTNLKGVNKVLKRMNGIATMTNARLVSLSNDEDYDRKYGDVLSFTGENDSSLDKSFTSGILKLKTGRHLQDGDTNKVLVHEEFAKKNNLSLNDKLKLVPCVYDKENKNQNGNVIEAEIVGIFSGTNPLKPTMETELCENMVYSDLDTVRQLYGYSNGKEIYQDATFYTENAGQTNRIINEAKRLDVDWKSYKLSQNGNEYVSLNESIEMLNGMIRILLIGSIVVGFVVLSFFLYMAIQSRQKEMGIFVSLGISKAKTISQLILEMIFIGALGFCLSFIGGRLISNTIGNQFLENVNKSSVENLNNGLNGMLGADLESADSARTLDELDVTIRANEVIVLSVLETGIIVGATLVSAYPILKKKPKEILTQMS